MASIERSDEKTADSIAVKYPTSADKRGWGRIYYQRRPYYLGQLGSAHSHAMYAIWLHHLHETGKPAETKDLRPIVDHFLSQHTARRPYWSRWPAAFAFSTLAICLTAAGIAKIVSSSLVPNVDGLALTADETDVVRGVRNFGQNQRVSLKPVVTQQTAAEALRQYKDGPPREPVYPTQKPD